MKHAILWIMAIVAMVLSGCGESSGDTVNTTITDSTVITIEDSEIKCFSMDNNGSECTTNEYEEAVEDILAQS